MLAELFTIESGSVLKLTETALREMEMQHSDVATSLDEAGYNAAALWKSNLEMNMFIHKVIQVSAFHILMVSIKTSRRMTQKRSLPVCQLSEGRQPHRDPEDNQWKRYAGRVRRLRSK